MLIYINHSVIIGLLHVHLVQGLIRGQNRGHSRQCDLKQRNRVWSNERQPEGSSRRSMRHLVPVGRNNVLPMTSVIYITGYQAQNLQKMTHNPQRWQLTLQKTYNYGTKIIIIQHSVTPSIFIKSSYSRNANITLEVFQRSKTTF